MNAMRLCALGLLSGSVLWACGSSPVTRFYTLNVLAPPSAPIAGTPTDGAIPVRVEPVAIPPELDRLELVNHSGSNSVHISESERWAAPLDEQIRRVLSDDLAARVPAREMADPNEPSTQDPRRRLSVSIGQFDASESCAVTLKASWTLQVPHLPSQSGVEQVQQSAAGACPAGLPATMSRALATLADRLAPIVSRPSP
jgi:uncharacterized protein